MPESIAQSCSTGLFEFDVCSVASAHCRQGNSQQQVWALKHSQARVQLARIHFVMRLRSGRGFAQSKAQCSDLDEIGSTRLALWRGTCFKGFERFSSPAAISAPRCGPSSPASYTSVFRAPISLRICATRRSPVSTLGNHQATTSVDLFESQRAVTRRHMSTPSKGGTGIREMVIEVEHACAVWSDEEGRRFAG